MEWGTWRAHTTVQAMRLARAVVIVVTMPLSMERRGGGTTHSCPLYRAASRTGRIAIRMSQSQASPHFERAKNSKGWDHR